jgi:hypothetical protein
LGLLRGLLLLVVAAVLLVLLLAAAAQTPDLGWPVPDPSAAQMRSAPAAAVGLALLLQTPAAAGRSSLLLGSRKQVTPPTLCLLLG